MAKKTTPAPAAADDTKLVGVRIDQPLQDAIQGWLDERKAMGLDLTLSQAMRYLLWVGIRSEQAATAKK